MLFFNIFIKKRKSFINKSAKNVILKTLKIQSVYGSISKS